jgi:hypothetical protein
VDLSVRLLSEQITAALGSSAPTAYPGLPRPAIINGVRRESRGDLSSLLTCLLQEGDSLGGEEVQTRRVIQEV